MILLAQLKEMIHSHPAIVASFSKPHYHLLRHPIDGHHAKHLLVPLRDVLLIDIHGVDPQSTIFRRMSQSTKRGVEILRDPKGSLVNEYVMCHFRATPCVGQGFIRDETIERDVD